MSNCAAKGCDVPLGDDTRMMCGRCWGLVPSALQSRVYKAWEAVANADGAYPVIGERDGKAIVIREFNESRAAAIDLVHKIEEARMKIAQGAAAVVTGEGQRVFPLLYDNDVGHQIGTVILDTNEYEKLLTEGVLVLAPAYMEDGVGRVNIMGFSLIPTPPGFKRP